MSKIKIMHFGDVHLGIENYGKIDPETGLNSRLTDFSRSLNAAIDKALEAGVNLALFAGDAYKSRDPNQTHQREFASCIRRLTDAGLPIVMLTGNHDLPNSRARANAIEIYRTLGVKNVHVLSKPEVLLIETTAGPIQIAAMPYLLRSVVLSREETRNLSIEETTDLMVRKYTDYIAYLARQLNPSIPSVLLGHFWIKNSKVSSQSSYLNVAEPEVLVSAVANPAFDYVAMGHIHKHQDLNKRGHPPVVYCGSIERIDFSEKDEEKGIVIVEVEKGSASYEFVSVPARRFVEIEVDADVDNPTQRILDEISSKRIDDAVVKLIYHISADKLPFVRDSDIQRALSSAFYVLPITKHIIRDKEAIRNRLLTESLDPLRALEMYFDTIEDYRKRKAELMDYARPLIQELIAEENIT
ncbi:MAG: exonuclease SbcCD subunit D [Armatimonadota bacterium]|nr:exonuclease SbcCD subunit D [Armatimonadota bacterium]